MSSIQEGLVVRAQSRRFTIRCGEEEIPAQVPKRLRFQFPDVVDPVAVGDRVRFSPGDPEAVIEGVLPRTNVLARPASGRAGKRQLLAANLDLAVVVLSAREPAWKPATIDRYLVLASSAGIPGLICLNKVDLDPSVESDPALSVYRELGIGVVRVSALTGRGIDTLNDALLGKTGVLIGPSGTGKSSLLNRLVPDAELRVGEVSDRTGKGMHTTTWVEMLDLPHGVRLVDSPGLRVLDLTGVDPAELAHHFPEMDARSAGCRFQDCRHLAEPACAIKHAVDEGEIAPSRYDSYRRIFKSLEAGRG